MVLTLRQLLIRDKAAIKILIDPNNGSVDYPYYIGETLYSVPIPNADTIALANTPEWKEIILGETPPPPPGTGTGLIKFALIAVIAYYFIGGGS